MNKTIVVNLLGGPGSKKSTTRAGVFHALKMAGINCEEVTEYAKSLTWEERSHALSCQPYVFGKQFFHMERLINKVDVIITDSPLILSDYYYQKYCKNRYPDSFSGFVRDVVASEFNGTTTTINVFLIRGLIPYNPAGRNQTEEEAREIDVELRDLLLSAGISYRSILGDRAAIPAILGLIADKMSDENADKIREYLKVPA